MTKLYEITMLFLNNLKVVNVKRVGSTSSLGKNKQMSLHHAGKADPEVS